ncbi:hypothetical protein SAMN04488516_10592 [Desulfonauticus submarinus]|uniref:CRISPR type III-B/RAMP module-associated protein Cmr5 n=1 Tax=Desulfonauticus submarinus TaxID=206665 RepID=A0A1H0DP26_9BACT|nr:hypothetical protein [Desulfonauticus submarinus]SDN71786.1 hypothetical protein SAMN04488516_10592 [Desulfonauticus submarinus]
MSSKINLDKICAEFGMDLLNKNIADSLTFEKRKKKVKSFETEITKALGIIVEDGPFAFLIWLESQKDDPHIAMMSITKELLLKLKLIEDSNIDIEKKFLKLSEDLTKTLFVKTILEKMLIYARYKAKAMQHE